MAFDLQSILAALGMSGGTGPALGAAGSGGPTNFVQSIPGMAQAAGVPGGTPQTPPGGGGLAGLLGLSPDALSGFGSQGGVGGSGLGGPLSLLSAGANMLGASRPGNAGIGSILGSGIGGLMSGAGVDRAQGLQQQQQASLQRIIDQLMKQPSGAQPAASASTPSAGGATPASTPPMPMMSAPRPAPQVPGGAPVPGPMGGGAPMGGSQAPNPFIQMMLQRRYGRTI